MNLPQSVQLIQSNGLTVLLVYELSVNQILTKRNPPLTERLFNFLLKPIYDNTNGVAATTAILGKYGAFVKSNFKPAKFDTPADFASGTIFFLVYPFKLSEKQVSDIEVRFWSGDNSNQLAIVEG